MDDVARLVAIEAIKQLKARYFRFVDTQDWQQLALLFTDRSVLDISDDIPGTILTGSKQIVETIRTSLDRCMTLHHGHCPEIEIRSRTSASGIWAMEDRIFWPDNADTPLRALHGFGQYLETYVTNDGHWKFETIKLRRIKVKVVPR